MSFHFELLKIMGAENLAKLKIDGLFQFLGWENQTLLSFGSGILVSCILISFVNAVFSELTAFSYTLQTLARERFLPFSNYFKANNKHGQPAGAIWLNAFIAFIITSFVGTIDSIMVVSNIGMIGAFSFATASLLKQQMQEKNYFSSFLTSLCFLSFAAVAYYTSLRISSFSQFYAVLVLVFVGVMLYFSKHSRRKLS